MREAAVIGTTAYTRCWCSTPGAHAGRDRPRRRISVWKIIRRSGRFPSGPGDELPRTQSTRKLRRAEIAETIRKGATAAPPKPENELAALLQKYAPGRTITPETTLDELGLSSLDRVQFMMELEQKRSTDVDESAFSPASDRRRSGPSRAGATAEPIEFPTYNRSRFARAARRLALPYFLLPLARIFAHIRVSGVENLAALRRPRNFCIEPSEPFRRPRHSGEPSLRACRYRVATAMSKEFFDAHFFPAGYSRREWFTNSLNYWLSTFFFTAFPIPQRHAGAGQTIRYMGEMVEQGWSILHLPGRRPHRYRRDPSVSARGWDDRNAFKCAGGSGAASWGSIACCIATPNGRAWDAWKSSSARR